MSNNGKIKSKGKGTKLSFIIGRGFGIIILIILISGAISIIGIQNTQSEYQDLIDGAVEADDTSMDMTIGILNARLVEKEFIATANESLLIAHDAYINSVLTSAEKIIELSLTKTTVDAATEAKVGIALYSTQVDEVFQNFRDRGGGVFGLTKGLIGDLKVTSNEMITMINADLAAGTINNTEAFQLHALLLDILLMEETYLNSRNTGEDYSVHVNKMSSNIADFLAIIKAKSYSILREAEWNNDWTTYQAAFTSVEDIDDEIESDLIIFEATAVTLLNKIFSIEEEVRIIQIQVQEDVKESVRQILVLTLTVILVSILVAIGLTIFITRGLVKPVYEIESEVELIGSGDLTSDFAFSKVPSSELMVLGTNVDNMKTSLVSIIGSIAGANKILNAASEDLFSGAEEINASAEEVASTSQAMSNGATTQTELIAEVNEDIQMLMQMVEEIIKKIQTNTADVSQIALQTNILALNAGIEASRAGDYGRGFMVVAENVRKLSDQSKDAAEKIALVADEIAENLQKSFNKISNSIVNIVSVSEETAASAEEVAAAAEEMTATVEELSSAAQELTTQAEESSKVIATFKIN